MTVYGSTPAEKRRASGTLGSNVPRPQALFPAPRLLDLRLTRRLSQARLAKAAGVARESVGNLENGGVARAETIERLASALGVTPEELIGQASP